MSENLYIYVGVEHLNSDREIECVNHGKVHFVIMHLLCANFVASFCKSISQNIRTGC